jgi:hypothetical protein
MPTSKGGLGLCRGGGGPYRGGGGAIEGAPLPFGHGGDRGLHECRSRAMTVSAVQVSGCRSIPRLCASIRQSSTKFEPFIPLTSWDIGLCGNFLKIRGGVLAPLACA